MKSLRVVCAMRDVDRRVFAIEQLQIDVATHPVYAHCHARLAPVALVVQTTSGTTALDLCGQPISLAALQRAVPELAGTLFDQLNDFPQQT